MNPLEKYKQKRKFSTTPEPTGITNQFTKKHPLRFVVQKHEASRLHFDFRLEVGGVLKSWAIPKGPSLDPKRKHLAVKVEDHPFEYKDFEGVIPKGNYGAGTVIIWDEGFYKPLGPNSSDPEKFFDEGIKKGHLVFILAGTKLKGEFALIKLGRGSKNDWLLVKARDWYASEEDVLKKDASVRSGLTSTEIKNGAILPKNDPLLVNAKLPSNIKPMLATLVNQAFDDSDWIFEIKWDGYRTLAEINNKKIRLYSRNNKDFKDKFPEVYESLTDYPKNAVFDGELVALDEKGRSSFQLLQDYQLTGKGSLVYFIFDILYYDSHNLTGMSLEQRRKILQKVLPKNKANIQLSEGIRQEGRQFFEIAKKEGLEGIVAKRLSSTYQTGKRSKNWLKIKHHLQQEAIICGFTKPKGSRNSFGALLLGVYENNQLTYIGDVGTGFNEALIKLIFKKMISIATTKSPFSEFSEPKSGVTWVKPDLVCEVKFQEWTKDSRMRQPVFMGLREDLSPKSVHRELPDSRQKPENNSREVNFSNPDKIFWPELAITKGELWNYYLKVSEYILPHITGRPQALNRFPNGIERENFYQKNVENTPSWIDVFKIKSGIDQHLVNHIVCNDIESLKYIINLGCIDINVWNSTKTQPDKPTFMVFDLDPIEIEYKYVLEAAITINDILKSIGITSYPKTSGKKGLHIYVPLNNRYAFEQVRDFAHIISVLAHQKLPKITSLERSPKNRYGKVYLDYLQNRQGATMAAPYSVRPVSFAGVSTPLTWDEVEKGIKPEDFTIKNTTKRLEDMGDIFLPVLGEGFDLEMIINKLVT